MLMSCGVRLASVKVALAACAVRSNPTKERALREKREGESVARVWPAIRIAWERRWGFAWRKEPETMIAAAAPSDVGQHWSLVRGGWIMGEDSISERV